MLVWQVVADHLRRDASHALRDARFALQRDFARVKQGVRRS